jgi:hypothetical protein
MTPEEIIKQYQQRNGSKGGKRTKELHPDHHKEAGRLGALKRWKNHSKKPQAS